MTPDRGECCCGCGTAVPHGRAWAPGGHDQKAVAWLIKLEYGSRADFLAEHGYGPGKKNLKREAAAKGLPRTAD